VQDMTIRKIRTAKLIIPAVCAAVIFFLSTKKVSAPELFSYSDKFYHALAYFIFSMTMIWAFSSAAGIASDKVIKASVFLSFVYGVSMELIQHFIAYRDASLADAIANMFGAVAAIPAAHLLNRWHLKRRGFHDR